MHVIRLRGPWDCQSAKEGPPGAVRYVRHFHCPTGLDQTSQVWLVLDPLPCPALVRLNQSSLGPVPGRYEVARILTPRNTIEVDLACPPESGPVSTIEGVRLEIEDG